MFEEEIRSLQEQGLHRCLTPLDSGQGPRVRVGGRELICLASNDYLGLATHPALARAACAAAERWGTGSGASRLLAGSLRLHSELEEAVADFMGSPAALLYNTGYAANTGVLPALCGAEDLILSDALNHASIVDGCRLSRAEKRIYNHCDLSELEDILKASSKYRKRWIVTESLFSMDGDLAPLAGIADLAERYAADIYVDEAHAVGIVGERGRGVAAHFEVAERITLRMGTLGKALGSFGAFVSGPRDVIDYLINRSRSLIYSTALPPPVVAASRAALNLVAGEQGDRLRAQLFSNVEVMARGLRRRKGDASGFASPILPLILGGVEQALETARILLEEGIYAPAVRPPTVPEGTARIRFSVTAAHRREDLERVVSILDRPPRER